jgi:hypothetical protein
MGRYSKKRYSKKRYSKRKNKSKNRKKTHRRKSLNRRFLKGGSVATASPEQQPGKSALLKEYEEIMKELDTFPLPEDPDKVVSRLNTQLYSELEKATTEGKKAEIEEKLISLEMAKPLYINEIMTSDEKNREKIKNIFTGLFKKGMAVTATIFTGPLGGIIMGSVSEILVRITEKLYNHMDAKAVSMDKARSSAKEESTLEDHRVLMSLMVNMFMPNYSWLKKTLFLKLCHFWVMGGVLINDMWWARLPVDNPPGGESDPRFKPSTAEKEFYDRLWLLCKTFIGLPGKEWNEMMRQIKTEMGTGNYELVMAKMEETLGNEEDIKSLKSVLGEAFVGELLGLVSSEIGEDFGDVFKDLNEGITEGINSIKARLPGILPDGVDVSELTAAGTTAKDFKDSVLANDKCSDDGAQCVHGTKVKTKKNKEGTIIDEKQMDPSFKQGIDNQYKNEDGSPQYTNPVYVSFKPEDIRGFEKEELKNPQTGEYVFPYSSEELHTDNIKEKARDYFIKKIQENVGDGGTGETDSGASETSPQSE